MLILELCFSSNSPKQTRRTQEKNAIVIQKWARKLMAQRELCRLARSKLADIEEELSRLDKPNKAEVSALLLKYFRVAIVAFFEFAHRDIDILVSSLTFFTSLQTVSF